LSTHVLVSGTQEWRALWESLQELKPKLGYFSPNSSLIFLLRSYYYTLSFAFDCWKELHLGFLVNKIFGYLERYYHVFGGRSYNYRKSLFEQLILYKKCFYIFCSCSYCKDLRDLWAVSKNKAIFAVPVMFKTLGLIKFIRIRSWLS
jgi:hypothetical protein